MVTKINTLEVFVRGKRCQVSSTCQAQTFAIGSRKSPAAIFIQSSNFHIEFYTDKFALLYTINSLTRGPQDQSQNRSQPVASFAYRNDHLHDCGIHTLGIQPFETGVGTGKIPVLV
jgi:hypothetical protein